MRLAVLSLIALAGCSGLADARPVSVGFTFQFQRAPRFVPAVPVAPVVAVPARVGFAPAASFSYGFHAQRSFAPFVAAPAYGFQAQAFRSFAPAYTYTYAPAPAPFVAAPVAFAPSYAAYSAPAALAPAGCSPQTAAQIAELKGQLQVLQLQMQVQAARQALPPAAP